MIEGFSKQFIKIYNNIDEYPLNFVLGLSGGVDSTALLILLKDFIQIHPSININIYPVIIDHGLRSNSSTEANAVKEMAQSLGFNPTIKRIIQKQNTGNIQNWARIGRRELLYQSAFSLSANLLLAHHYDDQVETVFMRLIRGSGIEGLLGMKDLHFWKGIFVIRPLLNFKKEDLIKYVKLNKVTFFQDPSNYALKYERVKIRKTLSDMNVRIWPNISNDLIKLNLKNKKLVSITNPIFAKWIEENIVIDKTGAARINFDNLRMLFNKSNIVSVNILGKVLQIVGGKEYPPKKKKTLTMLVSIFSKSFKKNNLGNVYSLLNGKFIFLIREERNLLFDMEVEKNKYYMFDGRFLLFSNVSGKLLRDKNFVSSNLNEDSIFFKYKKYINYTIPIIETLEGKIIKPYLSIISDVSFKKEKIENGYFGLYLINRLLV